MSRLLVRHLEIAALQDWTNHSAFEKCGDGFLASTSTEALDAANAISDPAEQEKAYRALFWPRSFGAGTIDYGTMEEGKTISLEAAEQLAAIEPPLIFLPLDINGHKVRLITILEIKPLIADAETKTAYFPIVVGLAIQADIGEEVTEEWLGQPWASFTGWDALDRNEIWEILHHCINKTLRALGPEPKPEMAEAILAVNAEFKVVAPKGDEAAMQSAIANAITNIQQSGELIKLTVERHTGTPPNCAHRERLIKLVKQVDEAESNEMKGKSLEALMAALFASVPSFNVFERVVTESEEIDLWITNNAECGPLRREGDVILAECKNWAGKCGKNEFNSLLLKMMNRSHRCTLGFLVSWNGFAETITKEMLRGSRDELLIIPLDGNKLRECCATGDFLTLMIKSRESALMI